MQAHQDHRDEQRPARRLRPSRQRDPLGARADHRAPRAARRRRRRPPAACLPRRATPNEQARQRAVFEERRKRWESWWAEHRRQFVTPEELRSVEMPKRDEDLVEHGRRRPIRGAVPDRAGCAARPGPDAAAHVVDYRDAKSHLDFDTGRVFSQYEGTEDGGLGPSAATSDRESPAGIGGMGSTSVARGPSTASTCSSGWWMTADGTPSRRRSGRVGRSGSAGKRPAHGPLREIVDRLQVRRAGDVPVHDARRRARASSRSSPRIRMPIGIDYGTGCGCPPRAGSTGRCGPRPAAEPRGARPPGTPFGKVVTTTLERPAEGRASLLDLETGRKASPRRTSLKPTSSRTRPPSPGMIGSPDGAGTRGSTCSAYVVTARPWPRLPPPRRTPQGRGTRVSLVLIGLDMVEGADPPAIVRRDDRRRGPRDPGADARAAIRHRVDEDRTPTWRNAPIRSRSGPAKAQWGCCRWKRPGRIRAS